MPRVSAELPGEAGVRTAIPAFSEPVAMPAPLKSVAKRPAARKPAVKKPPAAPVDAPPAAAPNAAAAAEPVALERAAAPASTEGELEPVTGRVKWFDATRGFGFLVSDQLDGDILLHFSVLRDHGRRNIPEGALVECIPVRVDRGLQVKKVLSIDLGSAAPSSSRPSVSLAERANRKALADAAGGFEPVLVKWFNRVKGYGFVNRPDGAENEDVFVHMETVRTAGLTDLQPGQSLEARIAASGKGLTAVELKAPAT